MFISSIKRWRSGLIAVAGLGSFIGWLLSVERSRNAQSDLDRAQSRHNRQASTRSLKPAPLPRSGFVPRPTADFMPTKRDFRFKPKPEFERRHDWPRRPTAATRTPRVATNHTAEPPLYLEGDARSSSKPRWREG